MKTLLLLALAAAFAAPTDEAAIRAARIESNRGMAAHDVAVFANSLTPEFHAVFSTNAQVDGHDAAVAYFAKLFTDRPDVVYVRSPDRITVNAHWGQAGESGHWKGHWTSADGVTHVSGEYYAKWRKLDNRWQLLSEIFVQTNCTGTHYCDAPPHP